MYICMYMDILLLKFRKLFIRIFICIHRSGYVLSGSTDKTAIITNLASGKVVSKLSGHTKKVCVTR